MIRFKCRFAIFLMVVASGFSSELYADDHANGVLRDVRYGPYHRNLLDVYLPTASQADGKQTAPKSGPTPVLIHFHGGGWISGDKKSVNAKWYLDNGIALVSVNYRYTMGSPDAAPFPAPMKDAARAVQYVRSRASDWNIDPKRVALTGSSAGAVMAMWIGYQDDMADPDAKDPVLRQSTRVQCLIPRNTPTTLDPDWIVKNIGGPKGIHIAAYPLFRIQSIAELRLPANQDKVKNASPASHVTSDDPPTFLDYGLPLTETPLPETVNENISIHHPQFGVYLKECLEEADVPCVLRYKGSEKTISQSEFLKQYLVAPKLGNPTQ